MLKTTENTNNRFLPKRPRRGFTLIELLVVIAVTSILLTVIFRPLISSYDLVSRASTKIESQTAARDAMRTISSLLSNAVYVFDNSGLNSPGSTATNTSLNMWFTDNGGNPILVTSRFSMIEYVAPARQLDQAPGGAPIDPTTGEPIYSASLSPGQSGVAIPVVSGRTLGRIWTGLIDNQSIQDTHIVTQSVNPYDKAQNGMPAKMYGNHFEDPRTVSPAQDNRYTIWNAEVPIYVMDATSSQYVPNLGLFHIKDSSGKVDDNIADYLDSTMRASKGLHLVLHDPNFFYDNSLAGGDGALRWKVNGWVDLNGDGKVEIWENWHAAATNVLLGSTRKIDAVALDRDSNTNAIQYYDGSGNLVSGATYGWPRVRPLVRFAPATVQNDNAAAGTADNAGNEAPSSVPASYTTQFTHWANPLRVLVYRNSDPNVNPASQSSLEYYETIDDGRIVHVTGASPGSANVDPTSMPDVGPQYDPSTGVFKNNQAEFAFTVDPERGVINFAFPSTATVHDANNNPKTAAYAPPNINAGMGTYGKRFLTLRTLDTTLNPSPAISPLDPSLKWANDARIVPGSEVVYGPDQIPGNHYGYRIQYSRVPALSEITGPNQYKINYEDQPNNPNNEMSLAKGYIEFNSQSDVNDTTLNTPDDPINGVYKPHSLPEQKVDLVNSRDVPADAVEVFYKFQVNRANDVVRVDYLTRELLNVTVEARLYDPASSRPQGAILTEKLKVRNLQH